MAGRDSMRRRRIGKEVERQLMHGIIKHSKDSATSPALNHCNQPFSVYILKLLLCRRALARH